MRKSSVIYFALCGFFAFGILMDWLIWDARPPAWTWNDVTQLIGVITLCLYWQATDAAAGNAIHRRSAQLLTILLPPLGTLVYFVQTRRWPQAIGATLLFWGGIIAVAFVVDEICYRLLT